jgi:hypothetical protein
MAITIRKQEALRFFCLARQAERSIDFALSSERQWDLLRQYYDGGRLGKVESAVESLRALAPAPAASLSREQAFEVSVFRVLTYPVRIILNRFRASWPFQESELQFILQTLQAVIDLLKRRQKPEARNLVQTRMDLHACEVIIERKLAGVPEVRKAGRIEHFCQAPHITPFKLEEIESLENEKPRRISA